MAALLGGALAAGFALSAGVPGGDARTPGHPGARAAVSVPIVIEAGGGIGGDVGVQPVRFGLPFPIGELHAAPVLELSQDLQALPVASRILSFWPDGSVRWLGLEVIEPAYVAGGRLTGTLRDRGEPKPPPGLLLVGHGEGARVSVDTGVIQLRAATAPGELFEIAAPGGGGLREPMRLRLDSITDSFHLTSLVPGAAAVERIGELSATLVRRDRFHAPSGRVAIEVTTRATAWRGLGVVCVQQSLDVRAGVHRLLEWTLELPLAAPPATAELVFGDGSTRLLSGDFRGVQLDHDTFRLAGQDYALSQQAVVGLGPLALGLRHFWQMHPSAYRRTGDDLAVELLPNATGAALTADEGFGATREVWLRIGPDRPADLAAAARQLEDPPVGHATGDWYARSRALGGLDFPRSGVDVELEQLVVESIDGMFNRRGLMPEQHYGLAHFGDFFDREHSPAYWGALQQEYDPGFVLLLQFVRSGDPALFRRGLEMAWHYADADLSPYGGAFQHRATIHHVDSWIAGIFAESFRLECQGSGYYDGTMDSVWTWVYWTYGAGRLARFQGWIAQEERHGAAGQELEWRLYRMLGIDYLDPIVAALPPSSGATPFEYAAQIALDPAAPARGYSDPVNDFVAFFDLYGGDWNDFPSFHTDVHPVPVRRHQGSHLLVQGMLLAHLLSGGEPRLREVILRVADHLVAELVPAEITQLEILRADPLAWLPTRIVAWPLLALASVSALTGGVPEEAALHEQVMTSAAACATALIQATPERIESSIHCGMSLEALAEYCRLTGDLGVRNYVRDLARAWSLAHYDWQAHAFLPRRGQPGEADSGMTGLLIYGLAWSQSLEQDPEVVEVLADAWPHLPSKVTYSKALAMVYRGALRSQRWVRAVLP